MTREQLRDTVERAGWTFVQGALGAAPVTFVPDWGWVQQSAAVMAVAGVASVLAFARGMVKARHSPR